MAVASRFPQIFVASLSVVSLALTGTLQAHAQSTIKRPGQRPGYSFELEPHGLLGAFEPPGDGRGTGFGLGVRGTVEAVKEGFLPKLNDSVGVGFGLDFVHYGGNGQTRGDCARFAAGPSGVPVCVETTNAYGRRSYFYLPVVMQWNFWLHRKWSAFGEPGVSVYFSDGAPRFTPFVVFVGGRYHFTDSVALTLRLGYPTISLGASFLF